MSLWAIPPLFCSTLAFHYATTPPNPPPSESERLRPTGTENLVGPLLFKAPKGILWVVTLIEIAAITSPVAFSCASHPRWTLFTLGLLTTLFGVSIRHACYRSLGDLFTFELSIRKGSGDHHEHPGTHVNPNVQAHKLITTGPYSIVRHPSYTGLLLVGAGVLACHSGTGVWECFGSAGTSGVSVPGLGTAILRSLAALHLIGIWGLVERIRKEDRMLRDAFAEEWEAWAKKVPYCLVPGVY